MPIESYGIIGDLHTVALVGMNGSIDFMCFPHFDSPSIFARLLDHEHGGYFQIVPELKGARQKQLYLPDSNILLTRFLSEEGVAEISDFMAVGNEGQAHCLVRRVKTVRGDITFRMVCQPRFDYARAGHRLEKKERVMRFLSEGKDQTALRLRAEVPLREENGAAVAHFELGAGETAAFVLERGEGESPSESADYVAESFKHTLNFWRDWIRHSTYKGRWREMVNRSALTLKLLTSARHGSLVAAATFGLPEVIGGERNWDYRFTWIRDSSFTLYALMKLGFTEEAGAFMKWIEERCQELKPDGSLQVLYGLDGHRQLTEEALPHLEGYKCSKPVRIGNAASEQLQLDIYGELMDAVYLYDQHGGTISYDFWTNLVRLLDWVCHHWREADQGVWEVRGGPKEFLYSRVLCWLALDRGIRVAHHRSYPAPLEQWYRIRDTIYHEVYNAFWDPELKSFVQYKGSKTVDAASLLMPLVQFISPNDPRWVSTMRMIERELVTDSLVYRYNFQNAAADGLTGQEGTFSMCSFWYVDCVARMGDYQKARLYFEKALGYANHLGLYSEEIGPAGEHLGNFPQAFTHLALISAAIELSGERQKVEGRRQK